MALDWLVRDNEPKDHNLFGEEFFGTEPPCTMFEKKPLLDPTRATRWRGSTPHGSP
jgi:6-oxo-cyclohex-1-ene-carbonyl-CoA hydrolase